MPKVSFNAKGYLEKSYLDKEGAKHIVFEVSAKYAVEIAKLELMARDLTNHEPILLDINVRQENGEQNRTPPEIPNARGITGKDKRVF